MALNDCRIHAEVSPATDHTTSLRGRFGGGANGGGVGSWVQSDRTNHDAGFWREKYVKHNTIGNTARRHHSGLKMSEYLSKSTAAAIHLSTSFGLHTLLLAPHSIPSFQRPINPLSIWPSRCLLSMVVVPTSTTITTTMSQRGRRQGSSTPHGVVLSGSSKSKSCS